MIGWAMHMSDHQGGPNLKSAVLKDGVPLASSSLVFTPLPSQSVSLQLLQMESCFCHVPWHKGFFSLLRQSLVNIRETFWDYCLEYDCCQIKTKYHDSTSRESLSKYIHFEQCICHASFYLMLFWGFCPVLLSPFWDQNVSISLLIHNEVSGPAMDFRLLRFELPMP